MINYELPYNVAKFIPEKTASYIFESNSTDDNSDPYVELYDDKLESLAENDDDESVNFCLKYSLDAGKTYYLAFCDYNADEANPYTVTVEEGCVHQGTEQNCKGYLCTSCGDYFGEKDETKHVWNNGGYYSLCYKDHDHTGYVTNGLCSVCKHQMSISVTTDDVTKYYDTTQAAFAACEDKSVVKLLHDYCDYEGDSSTISKAITLDMNGHTWSRYSSKSLYINADATIINSGSGGACNISIIINSAGVTLGSGNYRYIKTTVNESIEDHFPKCAAIYKNDDGTRLNLSNSNSVPSYTSINIKENHTPKNDFDGICSICGFYGTELSLGDNAISKSYARKWNENKYAEFSPFGRVHKRKNKHIAPTAMCLFLFSYSSTALASLSCFGSYFLTPKQKNNIWKSQTPPNIAQGM